MCWIGKNKPVVLEEDIPSYKIVSLYEENIISLYKNFKYKLNELYETTITCRENFFNDAVITFGFHSYSLHCNIESFNSNFFVKVKSAKDSSILDSFCKEESVVKLECIIPKGATLYLNELGEIVSNKIIPKSYTILFE